MLFKTYNIPIDRLLNVKYCNSILESNKDIELKLLPSIDILTDTAYQYFNRYALNENFLVFYQKSKKDKGTIHIDYLSKGCLSTNELHPYSLNVIIKGQGEMQWFKPLGPGILSQHNIGVTYRYWHSALKGKILDSWTEGKVALVKTDVPHQVYNNDLDDRVCISIRWRNMLMPWEELIFTLDRDIQQGIL
jgi:hypothetical protein